VTRKAAKASTSLTPKREKFAQLVATGKSGAEAYRRAFAVRPTTKPETVQQSASRLLADPNVTARVEALRRRAVKKAEITVDSLAKEFEEARLLAKKKGQAAAMVAATTGKGKLSGHLVERHRHSGAIGTYDLTNVSDEDLDRLESILGPLAHAGGDPGGEGEAEG